MAERLLPVNGNLVGRYRGYCRPKVLVIKTLDQYTVETISELGQLAHDRLTTLGFSNVHVYLGDGTLGLPQELPFNAIAVTVSAQEVPAIYLDSLKEND